jgi:hypothetical protein
MRAMAGWAEADVQRDAAEAYVDIDASVTALQRWPHTLRAYQVLTLLLSTCTKVQILTPDALLFPQDFVLYLLFVTTFFGVFYLQVFEFRIKTENVKKETTKKKQGERKNSRGL